MRSLILFFCFLQSAFRLDVPNAYVPAVGLVDDLYAADEFQVDLHLRSLLPRAGFLSGAVFGFGPRRIRVFCFVVALCSRRGG
jgi:hypothetical protein